MNELLEFLAVVYAIAIGLAVLDFRSKCRSPYLDADQRDPMPEAKARYR